MLHSRHLWGASSKRYLLTTAQTAVKIIPVIKPNLLRGAVYLLFLTSVCTIPSALPQSVFAPPEAAVILYDQTNNPAPTPTPPAPGGVTSQDFESQLDNRDSFAADDFVVPAGQVWNISEVDVIGESSEPPAPPESFHVFFYAGNSTLPGSLVATRLGNPFSGFGFFVITLTSPVTLTPGAYWISVQALENSSSSGYWFWDNRSLVSNSGAAWQNPGGGWMSGCLTWGRKTSCLPTQNGPDQLFRLIGTTGRLAPTPRLRPTPAPRP